MGVSSVRNYFAYCVVLAPKQPIWGCFVLIISELLNFFDKILYFF